MTVNNSQIAVFASVTLSSKHLIPSWIERLQEDFKIEDSDDEWATQLLEGKCRATMWCMCRVLGTTTEGVAAQACRILERYLAIKVKEQIRTMPEDDDDEVEGIQWQHYKQTLCDKMHLLMASSIQIAAKMKSANAQLTARKIHRSLMILGIAHTIDEVIASEYEVFQTIGFRLPMWNSLEVAELLALQVGLPPSRVVAHCVELAEYHRHWLEMRVRWAADVPNTNKMGTVRTLHLCAGAVACAGRLCARVKRSELTARLAAVTRAPLLLVRCLADCLIALLMHDDDVSTDATQPMIQDDDDTQ